MLSSTFVAFQPNLDRPSLHRAPKYVAAPILAVWAAVVFWLLTNHPFWLVLIAYAVHVTPETISGLDNSNKQRLILLIFYFYIYFFCSLQGIIPCSTNCVIGLLTMSLTFKAVWEEKQRENNKFINNLMNNSLPFINIYL